jgi:hypothetical protein
MTLPDILAQSAVLAFLILAYRHRDLINDCMDGNVDRIQREERNAAEAQAWLAQMKDTRQ